MMHVEQFGAGGRHVVALHGFPGGPADLHKLAVRLAEAGLSVHVPHLLGFGQSSGAFETEELMAGHQAACLLAALEASGVVRFAVVAHDFGGPVAAHLLRLAPERVTHLVLSSTNTFGDTPIPLPISLVCAPLVGGLASHALMSAPMLAFLGRTASRHGAPATNGFGEARAIRQIFTRSLRQMREVYAPVESALRESSLPSLVIWGDSDPFFSTEQAERTAALIGAGPPRVYEDTGHFPPFERDERFARDVLELLAT
jgi:pimeloyl-ACP methyl ester carboxylesterase